MRERERGQKREIDEREGKIMGEEKTEKCGNLIGTSGRNELCVFGVVDGPRLGILGEMEIPRAVLLALQHRILGDVPFLRGEREREGERAGI